MKSTEKSPDFNWLQFLGAASHLHVSVWDGSRLYSAPRSVRWELPLRRGGSEIFKEHLQNKHSAVSLMENMDTAPLTCFRDGVLNPHPSGLRNRSRTRSLNFLPLCVCFLRLIDLVLVSLAGFMRRESPSTPRSPPVGLSLCITSTPKNTKVKLSCSAGGWWIMKLRPPHIQPTTDINF